MQGYKHILEGSQDSPKNTHLMDNSKFKEKVKIQKSGEHVIDIIKEEAIMTERVGEEIEVDTDVLYFESLNENGKP